MTRKLWWFSFTAPVLIALASPWHAYSFDYKFHPGSLCQPQNGADAVHFRRDAGSIYNTNSLAALGVTCPILRDRVPPASPPHPDERTRLDVGVAFNFGDEKSTVRCAFISSDENGVQTRFFEQSIGPGPANKSVSLFWDVPPDKTSIGGTYSIVCALPVLVSLLHYGAGEEGNTDHPN